MDQGYLRLMPSGFFDRLDSCFIKRKDHRRQLLDVLCSTIILNSPKHKDLQRFDELLTEGMGELTPVNLKQASAQSYLACWFVAAIWPLLIHHDIASVQPISDATGTVRFTKLVPVDGADLLQLTPCEAEVTATEVHAAVSYEVLLGRSSACFYDCFCFLAREVALEMNARVLAKLVQEADAATNVRTHAAEPESGWTQSEWDAQVPRLFNEASIDLFNQRHGDVTHLFGGSSVLMRLLQPLYTTPYAEVLKGVEELPKRAGLVELSHVGVANHPQMRTYRAGAWRSKGEQEQLLLTRRGADHVRARDKVYGDASVIWAPHAARCDFDNATEVMTISFSTAAFFDASNAQLVRTRVSP